MTTSIETNSRHLLEQLHLLTVPELEALIEHHNEAYFVKHQPEISDEAFDKLTQVLKLKSPRSKVIQHLGEKAVSENTFIHKRFMLSLDKCYDEDEFRKWREKISGSVIAMPKIDGVACSIHYDKYGRLVVAATRGDGKVGDIITENVRRIRDVPNQINSTLFSHLLGKNEDTLEIRGEVHMKLSHFKNKFSQEFANPRNLAAGALKHKHADKSESYGLSFFPYDIRGITLAREREKFALLQTLGFHPSEIKIFEKGEDASVAYLEFAKHRDTFDYEIDGVVYRADDVAEQEKMGLTAHHPRWSIAYKYQGDSAQTQVVNVEWSVGRTGVITPVAVVKPVYVSGATITRASLHNLGLMRKMDLKTNSSVEIVRRGGVIPHVERVLAAVGEDISIPTQCPSCLGTVMEDGDFLRCANPSKCHQMLVGRLSHFCSVVDIQGFGEKLLKTLVEKGMVRQFADLYHLTVDELLPLDRMGKTLASKLVEHVNAKRKLTLTTFLTALGFSEVGPTVAEALVHYFPNLDALRRAKKEELMKIHHIGESIAESVIDGFAQYSDEIDALLQEIHLMKEPDLSEAALAHPLYGKGVVFTGSLTLFDRKEAQKRVRAIGGKTPSSVTQETDYLVVGDDGSPLLAGGEKSSKQKTAEKLIEQGHPILIITEGQFKNLLQQ